MIRTRVLAAALVTSAVVLLGCPTDPFGSSDSGNNNNNNGGNNSGLSVTSGAFSWAVTAHVPLPNNGTGQSCIATANGTTTVGSDGSYTISFPSLSCSSCTMTASTTGKITSTAANGTVTASITGSGCSAQQPTPSPATVTGTCSSTSCDVVTPNSASYSVEYTLTPG